MMPSMTPAISPAISNDATRDVSIAPPVELAQVPRHVYQPGEDFLRFPQVADTIVSRLKPEVHETSAALDSFNKLALKLGHTVVAIDRLDVKEKNPSSIKVISAKTDGKGKFDQTGTRADALNLASTIGSYPTKWGGTIKNHANLYIVKSKTGDYGVIALPPYSKNAIADGRKASEHGQQKPNLQADYGVREQIKYLQKFGLVVEKFRSASLL